VNRVHFVITVIVTVMWCTFATRQHKDSSMNFAEIALYWIWNHEDCSRFSEILL